MIEQSMLGMTIITPVFVVGYLLFRLSGQDDNKRTRREDYAHIYADMAVIAAFILDAIATLRGTK